MLAVRLRVIRGMRMINNDEIMLTFFTTYIQVGFMKTIILPTSTGSQIKKISPLNKCKSYDE